MFFIEDAFIPFPYEILIFQQNENENNSHVYFSMNNTIRNVN